MRLQKTMGDVRVVITESFGHRVRKEEPTIRDSNARKLQSINFEVNQEDADLHTVTSGLSQRDLLVFLINKHAILDSSDVIFARVNTQQGRVGEREFDRRIKKDQLRVT